MRRMNLYAMSAFLVTLFACNAGAQDSASSGGLVLRENVRRVVVDVVVTDSLGKAVKGLEASDFSLAEEGKAQRILSFEKHDLGPSPASAGRLPTLTPNTYLNLPETPERGPLYVLLLDLANTGDDDQARGRIQLLNFINSKPEGTRFAIFVFSDDLYLVQGFTSDRALLSKAVDPHQPNHHVPMIFLYGGNFGAGNVGVTLEIFHRIGEFVDGLPGRKNVIWLSAGFPLNLTPAVEQDPGLTTKTKDLLDTLARNQVSIYPVDVRGVMVIPPGFVMRLQRQYDGMDEIARLTGGHAFYSNNGVAGLLEKATEQGATYYTLSYSPTDRTYNGKLRHIEVELSNKGYGLSYRRSYYATDNRPTNEIASSKSKSKPRDLPALRPVGDSLYVEMQHGAPLAHDLLFKVHLEALGTPALATAEQMSNMAIGPSYFHERHKGKAAQAGPTVQVQTYTLDFALPSAQIFGKQRDGAELSPGLDPAVEVAIAAYDADGHMLNGSVEPALEPVGAVPEAKMVAAQAELPKVYRIRQQIDVPTGSASIRMALRDMRNDHIGAIELPLPLAPER